ncbi:MAG: 4-hydroxybenzoyl-CoA thioesterase [Candidatus Lumbricidophila eiseniae]|uniref:4-hydroxybenzoyl-CoA thioesterase n=1 Tax=Candidatus Lumbricidiphila eiseniae TaxID=1969409 RepID=A0A2A6FR70_9MICO|nr:MAG: 4-hydroxybenzoyl-CoA thioesterase [Candidatus Lumbricidophila eiseniae]
MRLHIPVALRWSDLDAYGHVNNVRLFGLLEEARIAAFWTTDDGMPRNAGHATAVLASGPGQSTNTLIARQEVEYTAPIPYQRKPIDIELWMSHLGGASLEVCYEVYSPIGVVPRVLFARAATTIVLIDGHSGRPRRITAEEQSAWRPYLEERTAFRRGSD